MKNLIFSSSASFAVWSLFFLFFLFIELLVAFSKWKDEPTDYDVIVEQMMRLRKKRAKELYSPENVKEELA